MTKIQGKENLEWFGIEQLVAQFCVIGACQNFPLQILLPSATYFQDAL